MFIISHTGHTIGIIGSGNVIQEMARVAAGERKDTTTGRPISFEDVSKILFFDHKLGSLEKKLKDPELKEFKQSIDRLREMGIGVSSVSDFMDFYKESHCIVFAPGHVLSEYYADSDKISAFPNNFSAADPSLDLTPFQRMYYALKADILRAAERWDKREEYETFYSESENKSSPWHKLGFYRITLDILENVETQKDFFKFVYDPSARCELAKLETKVRGKKWDAGEKEWSKQEVLVFEALKLALEAKKEGKLTLGYRLIDYLPFSLHLAVDYAKKIKETNIEPEKDGKTILVVTNEPGHVCNIMSMIHPQITPYLIGVSDNDSRRVRRDIINHFGLEGKMRPDELDMGIVGYHDVYGRLVWGRNVLAQIELKLGAPLSPTQIYDFFTTELYKVIARRIDEGKNPNTELGESIIVLANAALKSRGSGARVVGEFYDSIFIGSKSDKASVKPHERNSFGVTKHGFMDGRAVPLEVNLEIFQDPEKRQEFIDEYHNGLRENREFRQELIGKTSLKELMTRAKTKTLPAGPYVEGDKNKGTAKQSSTEPFPDNLKKEGVEILYSARNGVARVVFDNYGRLELKGVYDLNSPSGDHCKAITSFELHGRPQICAATSNRVMIYDAESHAVQSVSFQAGNNQTINFMGVARLGLRESDDKKIDAIVNENIPDLEQILLVNLRGAGLFGFSIYELAAADNMRIEKAQFTADSRNGKCLLLDTENFAYKLKGNRLFFAGLSFGEKTSDPTALVAGEYELILTQAKGLLNKDMPALPYGHMRGNYIGVVEKTKNRALINGCKTEAKSNDGIRETVTSLEVDTESNFMYMGTNKGRIFSCDIAHGRNELIYDNPLSGFIFNLQVFNYSDQQQLNGGNDGDIKLLHS